MARFGMGFYPGSGDKEETGKGKGLGHTFNEPVRFGTTRKEYHARFTNVPVGTHTVTETVAAGWNLFLVTPNNGIVNVVSGNACAGVFEVDACPAGIRRLLPACGTNSTR